MVLVLCPTNSTRVLLLYYSTTKYSTTLLLSTPLLYPTTPTPPTTTTTTLLILYCYTALLLYRAGEWAGRRRQGQAGHRAHGGTHAVGLS